MSGQERLFEALGGVDERLLERSERRPSRRRIRLGWVMGLAACLALAALVWTALPENPAANPDPPVVQADPVTPPNVEPGEAVPDRTEGQYHFLRFQMDLREPEVQFSIYINGESYYSYEQDGAYVVRPRMEPEGMPECKLEIFHMAGTGMPEALGIVKAQLEGQYTSVEEDEEPSLTAENPLCSTEKLFASNGVSWDDAQQEVWFADDGQGGTFIFAASYFLDATEGHRASFLDMVGTFTLAEDVPEWMSGLKDASQQLMEAVFADDLSGVQDLLSPDAWVAAYGENVSAYVSVGGIDYSVDAEAGYDSAVVSVKHRCSAEEPYSFLTIELSNIDGQWRADFIGLEK